MDTPAQPLPPVRFEAHPDRYRHWKLAVDGDLARLTMDVNPDAGLRPGYSLKLNSYDLGVDIELADAVQRLRFEHPEVKAVVVGGAKERVFCAGANINMLGQSSHPFKVNFCKFTNETRLAIEDASANSGQRYLAACNGTTAGGGYELALACDEIVLIDDGSSAVSLPEVPLLGVLPGTGGLTRVVDKRHVRRDRADVFCTTAEGIKGKRAQEWNLVDESVPRSRFAQAVDERARALAAGVKATKGRGIAWNPLGAFKHVTVSIDRARRVAELTLTAPSGPQPATPDAIEAAGCEWWALRAFRELDATLLDLRFNEEQVGLVLLRTRGNREAMLALDGVMAHHGSHWLVNETRLFIARTLRRLDLTARSLFAVADRESCFVGTLLEVALAADRTYALDDAAVQLGVSPLNAGAYPMTHGLPRLSLRSPESPTRAMELAASPRLLSASEADAAGLVTVLADALDFDDALRMAVEERASLSPDALTGMEASLRFPGPETADSKIFARLSAWQNWIFTRPNSTGEKGALTLYGKPDRPAFDFRRT